MIEINGRKYEKNAEDQWCLVGPCIVPSLEMQLGSALDEVERLRNMAREAETRVAARIVSPPAWYYHCVEEDLPMPDGYRRATYGDLDAGRSTHVVCACGRLARRDEDTGHVCVWRAVVKIAP